MLVAEEGPSYVTVVEVKGISPFIALMSHEGSRREAMDRGV